MLSCLISSLTNSRKDVVPTSYHHATHALFHLDLTLTAHFPNLKFVRLDLYQLFNLSEDMRRTFNRNELDHLSYKYVSLEELARNVFLYLVGGVHLDFDVVSVRSLDEDVELETRDNYVVMGPKLQRVNSAIMNFRAGNPFLKAVLRETVSL